MKMSTYSSVLCVLNIDLYSAVSVLRLDKKSIWLFKFLCSSDKRWRDTFSSENSFRAYESRRPSRSRLVFRKWDFEWFPAIAKRHRATPPSGNAMNKYEHFAFYTTVAAKTLSRCLDVESFSMRKQCPEQILFGTFYFDIAVAAK